ncbi:hypothetical protein AN221_33310 [Streptomyces nanshensis]|uniref:Uncharacterized protein n=1 Tax=Streptomyces nanshensis TaxID=518642 RepID=A0A1E7LJW6_9ACTN|nr:hypothetical protein AN221_33310 [Streptomyces nanshensis]
MLDVVAAAQEQRYEDGVGPAQTVQGVGEQRPVQLDVAEPDVEPGAQVADPVQEREDGPQGPRVAAAVGDDEEGGRGVAGGVRGGRAACCGGGPGAVHGSAGSVPGDEAELGGELGGDTGEELRGAVEGHGGVAVGPSGSGERGRGRVRRPVGVLRGRLRHGPMVPGGGCRAVA